VLGGGTVVVVVEVLDVEVLVVEAVVVDGSEGVVVVDDASASDTPVDRVKSVAGTVGCCEGCAGPAIGTTTSLLCAPHAASIAIAANTAVHVRRAGTFDASIIRLEPTCESYSRDRELLSAP